MKWTAHSGLWSNRQLVNGHWQKENIISFATGFHYVFSFGTFCCGLISYNCSPVHLFCWQRRCLRCLFQNWITARSGALCTRVKWFLLCAFISKWPGLWSGACSAQHAHVASNQNVDFCRLFFLVKRQNSFYILLLSENTLFVWLDLHICNIALFGWQDGVLVGLYLWLYIWHQPHLIIHSEFVFDDDEDVTFVLVSHMVYISPGAPLHVLHHTKWVKHATWFIFLWSSLFVLFWCWLVSLTQNHDL